VATSYQRLLRTPGAIAFSVPGFLARLPVSMLAFGVVVMASEISKSYGLAGAVSAALIVGGAVGAPLLGTLVDRFGQRRVLPASLGVHVVALGVVVYLTVSRAPTWTLFPTAALTGFALPPVSSMVRARWTYLLGAGTPLAQQAYAFESVVDELVFVVGPVIVTTLATLVVSWAGVACAGAFAIIGGTLFALQRRTEPPIAEPHHDDIGGRASALSLPGIRILSGTCIFIGLLFGTTDVALVAFAGVHGHRSLSGLLLACVSAGSGISGIWYGGRVWRATLRRRLVTSCGFLALTMSTLTFAPNLIVMAPLALVAGFSISPTLISCFGLAERIVPARMLTEGLTWVTTALGLGAGIGFSVSGVLIDSVGASRTLIVGPCAALAAAATAYLGRRHLSPGLPA
jgi:predicted MFS family arabinose efflux permease